MREIKAALYDEAFAGGPVAVIELEANEWTQLEPADRRITITKRDDQSIFVRFAPDLDVNRVPNLVDEDRQQWQPYCGTRQSVESYEAAMSLPTVKASLIMLPGYYVEFSKTGSTSLSTLGRMGQFSGETLHLGGRQ